MASRVARSIFSNAVRASARPARTAQNIGKRHMSASGTSPTHSSDKPWIIGSAIVFGPLFFYLLSPSARKSHAQHTTHDEKHDPSAHHPPAEVKLKDDEGTEADVTESLAASEHADAPKAADTDLSGKDFNYPTVSSTPGIESIKDSADGEVERDPSELGTTSDEALEKVGTFRQGEDIRPSAPTNMAPARVAAREQKTPKEQAEEKKQGEATED